MRGMAAPGKGICFVASPIGESESAVRKRSDDVLKFVIRPTAGECGYEALRADEIDEPGVITSQIVERVISSPMLIADLTDANPNVYYELALRHAVKKPAIHIIQADQRPAFDLGGNRTIFLDHTDLRSVESAKEQLKRQIMAAEKDPQAVDNPISVGAELQALRVSGNPLAESAARTEEMLHDLTSVTATRELSAVAGPLSYAWHASERLRDRLLALTQTGGDVPASIIKEICDELIGDVVTPLGMMRRHYGLSRWDPDLDTPPTA